MLIAVLVMVSALLLIHFTITLDSSWKQSVSVATIVFIYGFPYILAIPAIWDIALYNSIKNYFEHG